VHAGREAVRFPRPCLALVTDRTIFAGDLAAAVEACVAAGVDLVQVRERELGGAALLAHVDALLAAARRGARARGGRVRVVVNRRVDVALAAGADGAHLGTGALPAPSARALLGRGAWLGVSTHAPDEALALDPRVVDYAHLAPVFAPRSKRGERAPVGLEPLARACAGGVPVLAQGGVDATNAGACLACGAAGVAVTGEILLAADPGAAARALRAALDAGSRTQPAPAAQAPPAGRERR
jgi:thiamine-phosphate pyrophosphorylase